MPKKGKQGWRLITDLRGLKNFTKAVTQLNSLVEQCIDSVGMANPIYFCVFDIHSTFYHIPIKPEQRHYTAFNTPTYCFEFVTMNQGLKNAPATLTLLCKQFLKAYYLNICNIFSMTILSTPQCLILILHTCEKYLCVLVKLALSLI